VCAPPSITSDFARHLVRELNKEADTAANCALLRGTPGLQIYQQKLLRACKILRLTFDGAFKGATGEAAAGWVLWGACEGTRLFDEHGRQKEMTADRKPLGEDAAALWSSRELSERHFQVPGDTEHWVKLARGFWPFAAVEEKSPRWSSFFAEVAALRGGLSSVLRFCTEGRLQLYMGACTPNSFSWSGDDV
jgi:hypothetical protein